MALTIQIAVSFGHVHFSGARYGASAFAAVERHHAQVAQRVPAQPLQLPSDDDYCAICATIFLASTSFQPTAPVLPVQAVFERVIHPAHTAFALVVEPRRVAFQSRAPPAA